MERVRLGRTELMVSRIALGGIPIMRLSLEDAVAIVKAAIGWGINFIDTANGYRDSELKIGTAIKGLPREELVLASKSIAKDKQTFTQHLDLSLKQLGVDYLDIFHLHNVLPDKQEEIFGPGGAYEGLLEAIRAGKVRFPAFSSHSISFALELMRENRYDVVQLPFNYIDNMAAAEAIPLARELDMGFISMKPLGGGMLDNAGLSFRFLQEYTGIVPDPGIERLEELKEIIDIVEAGETLTEDDRLEIARMQKELGDTWCHRCDYCQPCPQKISISGVLSVESAIKRMPYERVLAIAEKNMANVPGCTACRACVARCPYDLDIPELIKEKLAVWEAYVAGQTGIS